MGVSYRQAAEYIADIPRFSRKNTLSDTRELLRRLGNPDGNLRIIHVAGTNGKGSVCAFLESIFRKAGFRTGLFTSPHLVRINERFQIDRCEICDGDFASVFEAVKNVCDEMIRDGYPHPSYFEFLFAMCMVYFSRQRTDVVLLETGLGGRLDATNVIKHPVLTVITSISLDHTEYLGDTVTEIAAEKAGILKPGVPVVYDASDPDAGRVIERRAAELACPCIPWKESMTKITGRSMRETSFSINCRYFRNLEAKVCFGADYQAHNASIAMMAAAAVRESGRLPQGAGTLTDETITEGTEMARWSGRMEECLPDVFLDGAHNEDGIREFLKTVERAAETRPVSLLFSAVSDKNWKKMIYEICSAAALKSVTVTQIPGAREVEARVLSDEFMKHTAAEISVVPDPEEAFMAALDRKGGGILYCTGSLYLVGIIKAGLAEGLSRAK